MKITLVIKAPSWSAKDADFFADLVSKMLSWSAKDADFFADLVSKMLWDHLDKPAFLASASYKAERAKKAKAKKKAKRA